LLEIVILSAIFKIKEQRQKARAKAKETIK